MLVNVWHNASRSADLGLNMALRSGVTPPEGADARPLDGDRWYWKEALTGADRHPLVLVFSFTANVKGGYPADVMQLLNVCYDQFNEGVSETGAKYRARRLRSLCTGDVITVDGVPWSCERDGWRQRSANEMRIIAGATAEDTVRERYEIPAWEPLSIVVPLFAPHLCTTCGMLANVDPEFHTQRYEHAPQYRDEAGQLLVWAGDGWQVLEITQPGSK